MLDRLSLLDASLLEREVPATPLHTGGVGIFGGDLAFERVAEILRTRVGRVPLARKRVQAAGLAGGRPVWVDDADFDLSYHLRHAALPPPGSAAQLGEFLARLLSAPAGPHPPAVGDVRDRGAGGRAPSGLPQGPRRHGRR